MPRLTALRQLTGHYGPADNIYMTVAPGQQFDASEKTAVSLESRGLVERFYERKMFSPPENKMVPAFPGGHPADPHDPERIETLTRIRRSR